MGDRAPGVFRLAQRRRTFRRGRCVGLMNGIGAAPAAVRPGSLGAGIDSPNIGRIGAMTRRSHSPWPMIIELL
jgi:hypothetical protein